MGYKVGIQVEFMVGQKRDISGSQEGGTRLDSPPPHLDGVQRGGEGVQ